ALADFVAEQEVPERLWVQSDGDRSVDCFRALQSIARRANLRVWNEGRYLVSGELHATLSALLIVNDRIHLLNLGGNRVYVMRRDRIRAIASSKPHNERYLGERRDVGELTAAGHPDFVTSFTIQLQPDDRVIVCTRSLHQQVAEQLADGRTAASDADIAEYICSRVGAYYNPADAARALRAEYRWGEATAIWLPLPQRQSTPMPGTEATQAPGAPHPSRAQPVINLNGGATVLWYGEHVELARTARLRRRRMQTQYLIAAFALLGLLYVLLAGTSQVLGQQSQARAIAAQQTSQVGTEQSIPPSPTQTATPPNTATALTVLELSPLATLLASTSAPQPSRTATAQRAPTLTFTPSPTLIPTDTAMPLVAAQDSGTPTATSISTTPCVPATLPISLPICAGDLRVEPAQP
ncbi:MAG TPA: hypothetical protein VFX76_13845, partial [Roseiflexaceae bacterium]|nr:hypothetical protein [Roseiflexaceae bacterium]